MNLSNNKQKIAAIQDELKKLELKITDPNLCKGTAETYARITGYYRNVSNFNNGKQTEFGERLEYKV